MVSFDEENPPPRMNSHQNNVDTQLDVPDDEDLTNDEDEEEDEEDEDGNDNIGQAGQKDNNSEYTEKNTITKEYLYNALDMCYIKKKITEYDMIKRIMAESDVYDSYLHDFKVRKYLRRLGFSPINATNERNRLSEKIKKEYAKKEKELFNKTHGKKGIPPVNIRMEKANNLRRFQF
jgi:hypothetical protein